MLPVFVSLAGHAVRWRLLTSLTAGDLRVRELTTAIGEPQSLVSYHLGRLRSGGLVSMRRSSADGRDVYYSIDLLRCEDLLGDAGTALHPGLRLVAVEPRRDRPARSRRHAPRVLFLCTGNSARSQMAEALIVEHAAFPVRASSAGSLPKPLHPNAVRVMHARGIDISNNHSKHLDRFSRRQFDYVVSLCDRVREVCPEFPGAPRVMHWSMPDPSHAGATDAQTYPAFERAADELEIRIRFLLAKIEQDLTQEVARS